jgi:ankyrin repeat protein
MTWRSSPVWPAAISAALLISQTFAAQNGDIRLIQAAKSGDEAAVTSLLDQKVNVNVAETDGTTALHWAVRQDELEIAGKLIGAGADVHAANRYGVTALYLAAVNGSARMIETLLDAGAPADFSGIDGETALMTAARTGNTEAAAVLLSRGADVNARENWRGQTALMWAAAQKHHALVQFLITRGADVNARSNVQQWERQNTAEPREKWLPPGGLTPLLFTAREGCKACVPILVEAGADIDAADPAGITPLLSALINGHYDTAAVLIEQGANPNLADNTGRTPLYAAVDFHTMPVSNRPAPKELDNESTSFDLIQALIAAGANVNAQLSRQQPYRTKLDRGDDTMFGAGTTPLLRAAKAADVAAIRILLEAGADASLTTRSGINPLMAAAGVGTREEDSTGRFKTQSATIEAIRLCLIAGVDLNAAESNGRTAVHGAATQGFDQVIQFLVDQGANLDVKDKQGRTPLDAAMGLAGGLGFDGSSGIAHESTAALIRSLMQ